MPTSSRRRRRSKKPPPSPSSAPSDARDWAALPQDILLAVFLKLGRPGEIMQGAELVCTTWRRVAVDEPMLWRRIDLGSASVLSPSGRAAARAAVDRGEGQCEAFSGHCDDDFLLYLVERAPCLKSLHLSSFGGPNEVLDVALKKLPLLEDLAVSPSYVSSATESLFESVCQACPLLRKLRMRFTTVYADTEYYYGDDLVREKIKGIVTTMCELRSLELLDCDLTAEGLTAILDHCPVLESLYITGCFSGEMDTELKAKCARVKNLTVPDDSTEDYEGEYEWTIKKKDSPVHVAPACAGSGTMEDEFDRIRYGDHEHRGYESWEMPFHPQYHFLCDEYPELFMDYGFP